MKTAQYIALTRACYQYSVAPTFHTAKGVVYFSLPQEFNEEEMHVTSLNTDEIADKFNGGATAEDIIVEMINWLTDHTCERCEQVSEDEFVEASDGDYICFDCYENMISARDYDATLDSMRGRDI
tara:strand:+ start:5432 stop:5806 length:375 start_codon:yes stop_codon:yes gene_type:complete